MRILFVTAELAPLAQSGGLGDAASGLARALRERGHEVACALPGYRRALASEACPQLVPAGDVRLPVPGGEVCGTWRRGELPGGIGLFLFDAPALFDRDGLYGDATGGYPDEALRFIAFARAAAQLGAHERPDVIACHDWHSALVPVLLGTAHAPLAHAIGRVQVVHNNAYQGRFPPEAMALTGLSKALFAPEALEFWGDLDLLKGGLLFADRIATVSASYAHEIQTKRFGGGLEGIYGARADRLTGIPNGLDTERFDPARDGALPARFDARDPSGKDACRRALLAELSLATPPPGRLLAAIGRFDPQKGWDVLAEALADLILGGASVVLLGDGDETLAESLRAAEERNPDRVRLSIGWDEGRARRIYAGCDLMLIPSRFEPCGLVQLFAQRYGTLPVGHAVGGLVDTIADGETGILFEPLAPVQLVEAVERGAALFAERGAERVRRRLMEVDVSWRLSARRWEELLLAAANDGASRGR